MCSDKDDFGVLEYCGGYCYNATVEYESKYLRCNENRISLSSHYTVFRQASILSGSGFNNFLVGLLRFQFFRENATD